MAIIPLCEDTDAAAAVRSMSASLDIEVEVPRSGIIRMDVERFKQRVQYVVLERDFTACLDACRVADFVMVILSSEQEVDELGELILRSVENQGLSTLVTVVQGLDKIEPLKRRPQVAASLKSYINHFHPDQDKVHNLDSRQECANLMRSICTTTPKGVRWRDERSWMLIEDARQGDVDGEYIVTGIVRGKGLKADRLVQIGDWGDFQIDKITAASLVHASRRVKGGEMDTEATSASQILDVPTEDQDDLAELAPEDMVDDVDMGPSMAMSTATSHTRGVLLDDHHYFPDDELHVPQMPKRLPKGTSAYQAAWYLGADMSDDGSDYEDVDVEGDMMMTTETPALPQDGVEGFAQREPTEYEKSEYAKSEMFLDPNPEEDDEEVEQLAAFRARKTDEAEDDKEFPDEIELLPNVLARERLIRYRGLKSLRTSKWEESEDRAHEPEDWRRLLRIHDYKSARSAVVREALVGGVRIGTRVNVHLRNVPPTLSSTYSALTPLTLFSLLRHEHKRAVLNFAITLSSDHPVPIRSKQEMILMIGPRRFVINPVFSAGGNSQNNIHKFDRFLHPGQHAVATFTGPVTWGSVPAMFFERSKIDPISTFSATKQLPLNLIATGTALPPSQSRVIAKRVILTGHPYKIHKKMVTIRYMFFNREDVEWFKALQLWTKRGRSGFIKEALGTHGYMKATFDGKINPQDSVGVSLYKRVWPRKSRAWRPDEYEAENEEVDAPRLIELDDVMDGLNDAESDGGVVV